MARIESLNILLTSGGKDFLAESYGGVIENIQKTSITSAIKNTALSGNPTGGTVEAKRFVNRNSNKYGTARAAATGQKVKASPVTIAIDTNRELITEVEDKDVALYGVDDFIARQVAMDEKSMVRELERAFFAEAAKVASSLTTEETAVDGIVEALIQTIEGAKNDYVDGVDRDMISVVLNTATYGKLRKYLDGVGTSNVKTNENDFGTFHGVRVYSSVYMPAGVNAIAMIDGAVAQPVRTSVAPPQKLELSDAIAFGLFFYYGTKAVMPELIVKYESE